MAGHRKAPARRAPARKAPAKKNEIRVYPAPPQDFDPLAATKRDLMRHGLPLRPDSYKEPGMAALWQRQAERYSGFEHLEPQPDTTTANKKGLPTKIAEVVPAFGPSPIESCGYQLFSPSGNFTALFVTWTVPDLRFSPGQSATVNGFHTFVGLGFLDVHVEMTVDPAQNVTARIWAQGVGNVNLPVRPGDVISGTLCLDSNGKAAYFFANETTAQTISFAINTGFPPAVTINAGLTRTGDTSRPPFFHPLASFGVVYFDEISAFSTSGSRSLTSGDAITMVNQNGKILARPVRLNDFAFKAVFAAAL
jgi:hypothetical protein